MRMIARLPLIVMACLPVSGVTAPESDAAFVEVTLRAQGLLPGKNPPPEQGEWAYEIRGTAHRPKFEKTACFAPEPRDLFEGKRFSFIADNRGEWGGELTVRQGKGRARTLIRENVIDMVPFNTTLYVFTGLDHGAMDHGAVYAIEDYDTKPRLRFITLLPGTPRAVSLDESRGGLLVVTRLSLTVVRTSSDTIDVLMARHAPLPEATSVMSVGRSEILIGICGGVAQVHLPWHSRPPDPDYNIPIVTYWTAQ